MNRALLAAFALLPVALAAGCSNEPSPDEEFDALVKRQDKEDAEREAKQRAADQVEQRLHDDWEAANVNPATFRSQEVQDLRAELAFARLMVFMNYGYEGNGYDCPPNLPVKGNEAEKADGSLVKVFHQPLWLYYGPTIPEECFKDAQAAKRAGYRASEIKEY